MSHTAAAVIAVLVLSAWGTVAAPPPPKVIPKPLPKGPNKLLFGRAGNVVMADPDGTNQKQLIDGKKIVFPAGLEAFSPDGTRVCLFWVSRARQGRASTILVVKLDGKDTGTDHGGNDELLWCCWSADGTRLLVSEADGEQTIARLKASHSEIDATTGKRTKLDLPADCLIIDGAPDGSFLSQRYLPAKKTDERGTSEMWLIGSDGKPKTEITPSDKDSCAWNGKFSPDGRRVVYSRGPRQIDKAQDGGGLAVYDIATGKSTPVADVPLNAVIRSVCWSPDGKKIAYSWYIAVEWKGDGNELPETEFHLTVCDVDGKNQKTIASEKGTFNSARIGNVFWH